MRWQERIDNKKQKAKKSEKQESEMKHNIGDEGMATGLDLSGIQQFNPYEDPTMLSNR